MNKQTLILPLLIAVLLGISSGVWVYDYVSFEVEPRLGGQDGRPEVSIDESPTGPLEGTLETFNIAGIVHPVPSQNWQGFRGDDFDGILDSEIPLARQWPDTGPTKVWDVALGEGYAGPAVYDWRVYMIDYDMEQQADAIRCFSLDDGQELWRYSYPVKIKRNHGMSRTVPAVNGKYLVTIGPKCHVTCLDAQTGEFKWMIDMVREYGTKTPLWYAGQCPLIVDNTVILAPAGKYVLMMAVDLETGEPVWTCPNPQQWEMTHCSILPMRFGNKDMYVYPGSRGIAGVSAEDGTLLWQTDAWYLRTNVPTPVEAGQGRIFLSAGYNKGSMMLQLKQDGENIVPEVLYELPAEEFGSDQQTPIYYQGYIYGVRPDKQFVCLDPSGEIVWTSGTENTYGLGPYMVVNEMIYVLNDDGVLSLIEATPQAFVPLDTAKVLEGHECWGPMALVGGQLLVRDFTTLVCLDVAAE